MTLAIKTQILQNDLLPNEDSMIAKFEMYGLPIEEILFGTCNVLIMLACKMCARNTKPFKHICAAVVCPVRKRFLNATVPVKIPY